MSYILDALKHSDRDRNRGKIPDIQSLPLSLPEVQVRQSSPPYIGALVVVVAITVLYLGFRLVQAPADPVVQLDQTRAWDNPAPAEVRNAPLPEALSGTVRMQLPTEGSDPVLRSDDWTLPVESLSDAEGVKLQIDKPVRLAATAPKSGNAARKVSSRSSDNTPSATRVPLNPVAAPSAPAVTRKPQPAEDQAEPEDTHNPYAGIPHMRQLPAQLQRELPELNFTVHIYSDSPSSRMVKINGQRLREGEQVASALRLIEITRDGVILKFKKQRFWRGAR